MLIKNLIVLLGLIVLMTFLTSCNDNWEADFYVGDSDSMMVTNADGSSVACNAIEFNEMACINKQQQIELAEYIYYCKHRDDDATSIDFGGR